MTSTVPLKIAIRMLEHAADLQPPAYATDGAAGMDIRAAIASDAVVALAPGARALVPGGFAIALPHGFEAQVRPRSGLAVRHGVTVLNAPGTVDADYRGEVQVALINHGEEVFEIRRGDRIAQLVIAPVMRVAWRLTQDLDETARGSGGFGSTGGSR